MLETKTVLRYGNLGIIACELVELLKDGSVNDSLTDQDILERTGYATAPGERNYPSIRTAIGYVTTNFGKTWKRDREIGGLRCLNAIEVIEQGKSTVRSIGRKARKATASLSGINYDELTDDDQKNARALTASLGTMAMFSQSSAVKKLANVTSPEIPNMKKLLSVFVD